MVSDIHIREFEEDLPSPRTKEPPLTTSVPIPFSYIPSEDGTDENLLILLHGLGESLISVVRTLESLLTSWSSQVIPISLSPN